MQLLHHVDVVQAGGTGAAPAHVFKGAGHIFLAVEVVGLVARISQGILRIVHHPGNLLVGGKSFPLFVEVRALLDGQGVDGDIGRVQGDGGVQGVLEALKIIGGQSGDEIHVDGGKARIHGLPVGAHHIGGGMGTAAGFQHGIHHGLGVDAHAVGAVCGDHMEFFLIQGVGPSALHGELDTAGKVEGLPDAVKQRFHLPGRQRGGGAASDIDGTQGFAGCCHELAGDPQLPVQRLQIGLHQVGVFADGLADEGAVGAAGGAEGNAHIQRYVMGFHFFDGGHGVFGAVQTELCPLGGDEIGIFHLPECFLVTHTGLQAAGGELGGPDTGERAPGGDFFQEGKCRLIVALLQNPAAGGDSLLIGGKVYAAAVLLAADVYDGQSGQGRIAPGQQGQCAVAVKIVHHTGVIHDGGVVYRLHGLQGKQRKLHLLHRIAFLVVD